MRARSFHRKQQIYRAIEAENARAQMSAVIRVREITAPPAPLPQPDDRNAIDMASAASRALRSARA